MDVAKRTKKTLYQKLVARLDRYYLLMRERIHKGRNSVQSLVIYLMEWSTIQKHISLWVLLIVYDDFIYTRLQ